MRHFALVAAIGFLLASALPARSDDAAAFADEQCGGCHGKAGNYDDPFVPRLAGQQKDYIMARIKGFADPKRVDRHARFFMAPNAMKLTDAELNRLAAYYASVPPASVPAGDPALVRRGRAIYEGTATGRGLPTCAGCHGAKAAGRKAIPRLAGQHADFLRKQLSYFKMGAPRNDVAHVDVKNLSFEDIDALAAFLEQR